ncbi:MULTISPECIES: tetratricopeptide repeat protein [unclassified Microcoleus]|uniref:tetratricopeptide repeat protein n=1 Tax=unclassified Microcoleus TaxID=2642155 RepID=UPI0025D77200|nr:MULTISPECIES: tetratricopeptide repeat protein [unclassified Microcoleus]
MLKQWLDDTSIRLITITAAGGYGKSTLASKLYEEALGFNHQFWIYFDLPYRFGKWGRWILAQLGQEFDERLPDEQLSVALVNRLSQGHFFLVLDNLETLLKDETRWQPYRFFLQALCDSSGHSRVLITSRIKPEGLPWLSEEMDIKGLSEEAALDFLDAMKVQGTHTDLKQFVTLTGCHPLLLKLTVEWLRKKRGKSANVAFILGQQDINLFRDIVGNHQGDPEVSIGKVLEQSVSLLPLSLQQLWQDLSVYRRSFGLAQAKAMQPEATEENLRELARYALLQEEPTEKSWEFSFLPLLQRFAQERSGEQTGKHKRAIAYYIEIAKPKPWTTLEDIISYLEVFYHYYTLNDYSSAFKVLYGCNEFLYTRSYNIIRVELYEPLLQKWMPTARHQEKADIGRALTCLGNANHALGEYCKAIEYHELCRIAFREIGDQGGESTALTHLGNAYQATGQYEQAINCYQEALELAREIDEPYGQANALGNMGNVHQALGKYQQAIQCHQQSLEIKQKLGKRFDEGYSLGGLGNSYQALGYYQEAIEYHRKWLEIAREIGDRRGEAYSLGGLANAYQALGQYEKSIKYHQQALQIVQEVHDRQGIVYALMGLSDAYQSLKNYQQAIEFLKQYLEITQAIKDRLGEARAWFNSGHILVKLRRSTNAIAAYTHACELFQATGLEQQAWECKEAIKRIKGVKP